MENKVIWITGASSGIGEALVYEYSRLGAYLIISSRNRDELFRVKSNCINQINVHVLSLDLEQTATLNSKAEDALRIYGKIDMLINSGGISQRALALETNLATEQRLMNTNFWGTIILSKALLPQMLKNGNGNIVVMSSLVGKFGTSYRSAYAASKHALHGYFDSLRSEVDIAKISILLVCPGFIRTNVSVNALTANGTAQNSMDEAQANGMAAETCAKIIVKAIDEKKEEIYVGGKETRGILLKRFFPKMFSKIIRTCENKIT